MFRVCPPYILFWRLKHLPDRYGQRARTGQSASRDSPRAKNASWYGTAAEQEDVLWGRDTSSCLTLSSYFPSSYYIDGRVAKVTDFLKTRLLDTLSDQIRKIQKVSKCKGTPWQQCLAVAPLVAGAQRRQLPGSRCGAGRDRVGPVLPVQVQPALIRGRGETPGSTKPGPSVGCVLGFEGSGHRLQHAMGCAGVLGHRAGENAMQGPAEAADWLEAPICLFLKGAACSEGETELAPQKEQPGGTEPS